MLRALALALATLVSLPALADEMWRWTDEEGTPHYTNDKSAIPAKYRAKATRTEGADIGVVSIDEGNSAQAVIDKVTAPRSGQVIEAAGDDEGEDEPPPRPAGPAKFTNDVRQVLVFGAPWCQPCLLLKKQGTLQQLVEANPGLKLREIDADQRSDLAKKYGITVLPTVVFTDQGGKEFLRVRGPKSLAQFERALLTARGQQVN